MSEANWRQCAEYEVKEVSVGMHNVFVYQMCELSLDAMFAMLSEMDTEQTEISGTRIWTGSLALSHYLLTHADILRGTCTLELGAGTGMCSIVAKKLGAGMCIATDGDDQVVQILKENVRLNEESVHAHILSWGDAKSHNQLLAQFPGLKSNSTLILAADVLYKAMLIPLLLDSVTKIFDDASGAKQSHLFLLCHVPRAQVSHDMVENALKASRFEYSVQSIRDIHDINLEEMLKLEECPKEEYLQTKIYRITAISGDSVDSGVLFSGTKEYFSSPCTR
uniref:Uncharacterized protein AlNc14C27G2622 n=1 Tax=Albugo laibachii Nc14 TaxID=890382 RepID=F0W6Y9_9STRA|nr:conserved hypothetical protein [Albugo laibachii Nc14]|eukprot:CCA16884.1 conserved hypothetical protein [Albugo laibachii Nc14]